MLVCYHFQVIAVAIAIGVALHGGAHLTCNFPKTYSRDQREVQAYGSLLWGGAAFQLLVVFERSGRGDWHYNGGLDGHCFHTSHPFV